MLVQEQFVFQQGAAIMPDASNNANRPVQNPKPPSPPPPKTTNPGIRIKDAGRLIRKKRNSR